MNIGRLVVHVPVVVLVLSVSVATVALCQREEECTVLSFMGLSSLADSSSSSSSSGTGTSVLMSDSGASATTGSGEQQASQQTMLNAPRRFDVLGCSPPLPPLAAASTSGDHPVVEWLSPFMSEQPFYYFDIGANSLTRNVLRCASYCAVTSNVQSTVQFALLHAGSAVDVDPKRMSLFDYWAYKEKLVCYCLQGSVADDGVLLAPLATARNFSSPPIKSSTVTGSSLTSDSTGSSLSSSATVDTGNGNDDGPQDISWWTNGSALCGPQEGGGASSTGTAIRHSFPVFVLNFVCAPLGEDPSVSCGPQCVRAQGSGCCVYHESSEGTFSYWIFLYIAIGIVLAVLAECLLSCAARRYREFRENNDGMERSEGDVPLLEHHHGEEVDENGEEIGGYNKRNLRDITESECFVETIIQGLSTSVMSVSLDPHTDATNCAICLEFLLGSRRILPCGHMMHDHCLRQYLVHNLRRHKALICPVCRESVLDQPPSDLLTAERSYESPLRRLLRF